MNETYYIGIVKALSPIMIRSRRTPRGYESLSDILPSSTLAGALARALHLGSGPALIARGYAVSDAYPVAGDDYRPAIPSTATTYRIKRIDETFEDRLPSAFFCLSLPSAGASAVEVYEQVYRLVEEIIGFKPSGLMKNVGPGKPVILDKPETVRENVPCVPARVISIEASHSYDSVAINPGRGSAEAEMLFTYYALPRGTCFWFTAVLPNDKGSEIRIEARIGGRLSAGYGKARIVLERLGQDDIDRLESHHRGRRWNYLYLWSPLPSTMFTGFFRPGWSHAVERPRLAVSLTPSGSIVEAHVSLEEGVVETRFRGVMPPYGQAEPVYSSEVAPYSYALLSPRISRLCERLESLV